MKDEIVRRDGCEALEPLLSSYAAGALDEESETRVREHLYACASCRAAQVERDPSVIFMEMHRAPLPDGFLETIPADVRRRVEAGARPRRGFFLGGVPVFGTRRLAYVAAPLMAFFLLGTLVLLRPGGVGLRGPRRPGAGGVTSPFVVPPGSTRPGRPATPGQAGIPALPGLTAPAAPGAPPLMEEVGSPSARVYRFTVEGDADETPIYFVVDESIDI
jgi:anti-sigma factor RsiW